jgi:putative ABC transport system permease protein
VIVDTVLDALRAVAANRVRSLLTMLSIAIGVFGVIVLMAVAAGAARGTEAQLSGLGSPRVIDVYSSYLPGVTAEGPPAAAPDTPVGPDGEELDAFDAFDPQAQPLPAPAPQPLTAADVALLNDPARAPDVAAAAGYFSVPAPMTGPDGTMAEGDLLATGAELAAVRDLRLAAGTFLTPADVAERARVVVVGQPLADQMGAGVGDEITIAGARYEVVGIVAGELYDSGSGAMSGYVPETTAQDLVLGPREGYDSVVAVATSEETVEAAAGQVRDTIREAHLLGPTDVLDVEVYTRTEELASIRRISLILQALAAAIAGVSLFVGGIGVMNIMLVTVTERTREIGIRMALGAQRHHLLGQFLLEATTLTVLGGTAGMLLGLLTQYVSVQGYSPVVTPFSVVVAVTFSVATGLFFGLYPANRAASLPPVHALRHE